MTYSSYLRNRSGECIHLAVATAGQKGTAALIDLAQDYAACADRWERSACGSGDRELEAEPEREAEPDRAWWQLLPWTRH